uniref:Secreted protein n=1 Tax=Rhabditophanes sp. KR3021 TaxID=114890 RepID=A0AC35TU77_9BILA
MARRLFLSFYLVILISVCTAQQQGFWNNPFILTSPPTPPNYPYLYNLAPKSYDSVKDTPQYFAQRENPYAKRTNLFRVDDTYHHVEVDRNNQIIGRYYLLCGSGTNCGRGRK